MRHCRACWLYRQRGKATVLGDLACGVTCLLYRGREHAVVLGKLAAVSAERNGVDENKANAENFFLHSCWSRKIFPRALR